MKEEYYIPDIEDIRVGYECENLIDVLTPNTVGKEWRKLIVFKDILRYVVSWVDIEVIRTPYLTKEQIEKEEGFELQKMDFGSDKYGFRKGNYWFILRNLPLWNGKGLTGEKRLYLTIIPIDAVESEIDVDSHFPRYFGPCPSINEFRNICKLLNI